MKKKTKPKAPKKPVLTRFYTANIPTLFYERVEAIRKRYGFNKREAIQAMIQALESQEKRGALVEVR